MKIGIIGCGGMGTTHYLSLRALAEQEGVEVTCIAECRKEFLIRQLLISPMQGPTSMAWI